MNLPIFQFLICDDLWIDFGGFLLGLQVTTRDAEIPIS